MENKKTNKLVILLIILILCLLVGGGFLVYTLLSNNHGFSIVDLFNKNQHLSGEKNNESTLPEWAEYLLNQDITEITYQTGEYGSNSQCVSKTMTKAQLKDVLTRMTSAPLVKRRIGGFGGVCYYGIIIKINDKTMDILMGKFISKDGFNEEILKLVEKEKYTLIDDPNLSIEQEYYYEYVWDTSYLDNMFS